ncbi:fatty acyl-AMP ligase [Streptomyces anandii]|uniref:fatty acyl-AMP ligase n=1 Tax=Streptomyces anandii TaxID=285454 RepID=UPI0037960B1F
MTDTLSHHLARAAALTPDETSFTFVDHGTDTEGAASSLSWSELNDHVRAVATGLRQAGAEGERVAVLAPQGLDYVVGFLAAAHAGAVAVPLPSPSLPGHAEKLAAVLRDAAPAVLLTVETQRRLLSDFCEARSVGAGCRIASVLELGRASAEPEAGSCGARPDDVAYLQYTSGSTRIPTGVEITHANVCVNARQILEAYDLRRGHNCTVGWLPLYHDMGLVVQVVLALVGHMPSVFMDPLAFIQQPARWLRLLSRHTGAMTAAPNFAYDYCVRRLHETERSELSLASVAAMANGSEPVSPATIERFHAAFAPAGVTRTAVRPSYGLAEATVFVSASPTGEATTVTAFDRDALGKGVAVPAEPGERPVAELVACGRPIGQELAIVDPVTHRRREDGRIGEIWLSGPNIGRGYWGRPEESEAVFRAVLHAEEGTGPWLRTGDLGVWHDKQLYVTGRLKDLVIIDGTNHYPYDIEETVHSAHPAIRPHRIAAFAVPGPEGELLVVVAEHRREAGLDDTTGAQVANAVRAAVAARHGINVHDFVLVPPGGVPHTTSGKVARSACRDEYLSRTGSAGANT